MLNNTRDEDQSVAGIEEGRCNCVLCVPLFRNRNKSQNHSKCIGSMCDRVDGTKNKGRLSVLNASKEGYRRGYEVGKAMDQANGQRQWDNYECLVLHVQSYNKKGGNCRYHFFLE